MNDANTFDWTSLSQQLDETGFALIPGVLPSKTCNDLTSLYSSTSCFRSVIDMQRYRFGRGEYKYFQYPLPAPVASLRKTFYTPLSRLANQWMERLGNPLSYPEEHEEFVGLCRDKGQTRPTPLLLRYEAGGYNTLHQDLYGDIYFPFQVVFPLTQYGVDHTGGELVFVEQLPRAQSRATVLSPGKGDAVIFTTNFRPVSGARGYYRARMKHGVSPVTSGVRYALGVIFHDAT